MTALPAPPALSTSDPGSPANAFGGAGGIASLINAALALCFPTARVVTASGAVTVATTDGDVLINKTTPAATAVALPAASTATRIVTIKDMAGNAATYNITITPNGSEKIDGLSSVVIVTNYGAVTLYPLAAGGWYMK